ncbi:MAG: hypothetical protein WCE79_03570 [Xanthobacteraceae bacterium]
MQVKDAMPRAAAFPSAPSSLNGWNLAYRADVDAVARVALALDRQSKSLRR